MHDILYDSRQPASNENNKQFAVSTGAPGIREVLKSNKNYLSNKRQKLLPVRNEKSDLHVDDDKENESPRTHGQTSMFINASGPSVSLGILSDWEDAADLEDATLPPIVTRADSIVDGTPTCYACKAVGRKPNVVADEVDGDKCKSCAGSIVQRWINGLPQNTSNATSTSDEDAMEASDRRVSGRGDQAGAWRTTDEWQMQIQANFMEFRDKKEDIENIDLGMINLAESDDEVEFDSGLE